MFRSSFKPIAVAAMVIFALGASAFAGCTSGSQLSLSINPTTADPGDTVTISSGIHNTTSSFEVVRVTYTLTVPSSVPKQFMATVLFPLAPNASVSETFTKFLPPPTPLGTYTVTASGLTSAAHVGSCTATLNVVANDGD